MNAELAVEERERLVQSDLHGHFKPEFLNRLDETIHFSPISLESLQQIVGVQCDLLFARAREQGLHVKAPAAILESLAERGYDPQFGARPLKRLIQQQVGNLLSRVILKGEYDSEKEYALVYDDGMLKLKG